MKKENKKENLFVIVGIDETSRFEEIYKNLEEKYKFTDFDKKVFYGGEVTINDIIEEIDFLPVFSEKKLIIIKNVENLLKSECEKLEEIIEKAKDVIFILTGTDINMPLKKYAEVYSPFKTPEQMLFSQIYSIRKENKGKLRSLIREYVSQREKNFQVIIGAANLYLKNVFLNRKKLDRETIKKFEQLHQLDFSLKIGKILPGEELEIFIYYFFS